MKLSSLSRRGPGLPGVALVMVISLLALLTVVSVTLLLVVGQASERAADGVGALQSEVLARGAFDTVLADLGDEMEKGSPVAKVNRSPDGRLFREYDLRSRRTAMRVTRSLVADVAEDSLLVKQSQPDQPFHTWPAAVAARGSSVSTATGAGALPPSLWDKPRLLPESERFDEGSAPTWIYVSRDGGQPKSYEDALKQPIGAAGALNPDFVTGRYAYNLYETSGIIDVNVAGFPAQGGPPEEWTGSKGSLAFADLSVIPGFSRGGVDALANWRHRWESDPGEYLRLSEGTGWQRMAAADNWFVGRQDLLAFARKNPEALPLEVLPRVTHFSRDLDAPSHRPDPRRLRVVRKTGVGGNDANGADLTVNPELPTFNEKRGGPLLGRRFPLERLKYVATPEGSDPLDAARAEKYFGLRWQNGYWEYVHARPNGDLFTLQDVPEDREPNFFEILRATVLVGGLGRQYGATGFAADDQTASMHRLGGVDGSVNINIMEMGACIIDQYDRDQLPTALQLPGSARPYYVFGKEDVPYLYRMSAIPFRGKVLPQVIVYDNGGNPAKTEAYEASMVLQPCLWRPHQPAATGGTVPTRFRIRPQHVDPGGGSLFYLFGGWSVPGKGSPPGIPARGAEGDYSYWNGPNYRKTHPELYPKTFTGEEYLECTVPADSTAFREPQSVHSPAHGAIAGYTVAGNVPPIPVRRDDLRWNGLPKGYEEVSGFLAGYALHARIERDPGHPTSNDNRIGNGFYRGDPVEVLMEYEAPDGTWRPYQRVEFTFKSTFSRHYDQDPNWESRSWYWTSFLVDPRTSRFGGIAGTSRSWDGGDDWGALHWPEAASMRYKKNRTDRRGSYTAAAGVWSWWTAPAPRTGWSYNGAVEWWMSFNHVGCLENDKTAWDETYTLAYRDADEILRPGVGAMNEFSKGVFTGNPMSQRHQVSDTGLLTRSESLTGRPRVLNRPFRSVGELGHAFRGTPWRDIDLLYSNSADAGLLDVFRLYEDPDEESGATAGTASGKDPQVVAGRVNLNTASPEVIAALLSGAARDDDNVLQPAEATSLAKVLYDGLRTGGAYGGPVLSKSELVTRASDSRLEPTGLVSLMADRFDSAEDRSINDRREAVVRALSDGTTVRAWTFMLDLVVQSGRLGPVAASLEDFQPVAERRYWVHFSLDRLSGQLLDVQWERVGG